MADREEKLDAPALIPAGNPGIYRHLSHSLFPHLDMGSGKDNGNDLPVLNMETLLEQGDLSLDMVSQKSNSLLTQIYEAGNKLLQQKKYKSTGLGYPVLHLRSNDKDPSIFAPVFIWTLQMTPAASGQNNWQITHKSGNRVRPNPFLIDYLHHKYQVDIRDIFENAAKRSPFSKPLLMQLIHKLNLRLRLPETDWKSGTIDPLPAAIELENSSAENQMYWSAILSVFPPGYIHSRTRSNHFKDKAPASISSDKTDSLSYGLTCPNPSQKEILRHINRFNPLIFQGDDKSGNIQTLNSLLVNRIIQGQRCLVVAESVTELHRVEEMLSSSGITDLSLLLTDPHYDKERVLNRMYLKDMPAIRENKKLSRKFENHRIFCRRAQEQLDSSSKFLNKPKFGDLNWQELIALYIEKEQVCSKTLLLHHLYPKDFEFNYPDFVQNRALVQKAEQLFTAMQLKAHPLEVLHSDIFNKQNYEEVHPQLATRLQQLLQAAKILHQQYLDQLGNYEALLEQHFENHADALVDEIRTIRQQIEDFRILYGSQYDSKKLFEKGKLKVLGLFSQKHQQIKERRSAIFRAYDDLCQNNSINNYSEYTLPVLTEENDISEAEQQLQLAQETLLEWKKHIPDLLKEHMPRLSEKNSHQAVPYQDSIQNLVESLDNFGTGNK